MYFRFFRLFLTDALAPLCTLGAPIRDWGKFLNIHVYHKTHAIHSSRGRGLSGQWSVWSPLCNECPHRGQESVDRYRTETLGDQKTDNTCRQVGLNARWSEHVRIIVEGSQILGYYDFFQRLFLFSFLTFFREKLFSPFLLIFSW